MGETWGNIMYPARAGEDLRSRDKLDLEETFMDGTFSAAKKVAAIP